MNINFLFFIILTFYSFSSLASDFIFFDSTKDIRISGDSNTNQIIEGPCSQVDQQVESINVFMQRHYPQEICEMKKAVTKDGPSCSLDLNYCFPKKLLSLVTNTYKQDGPNCYGTTMFATKNSQHLRFVSEKEFSAFINSPYCIKVDKPIPGDIGYYKAPGHEILHGYTFLSPQFTYEKMGADNRFQDLVFPVTISDFRNMNYLWEASKECRQYGRGSKDCYNQHFYVRCDTSGYYDQLPSHIRTALLNLNSELEIASQQSTAQNLREDKKSLLLKRFTQLFKVLGNNDLRNQSLAKILYAQLMSIRDQIKGMPDSK